MKWAHAIWAGVLSLMFSFLCKATPMEGVILYFILAHHFSRKSAHE